MGQERTGNPTNQPTNQPDVTRQPAPKQPDAGSTTKTPETRTPQTPPK